MTTFAELAGELETWLATDAAWRQVDLAGSKEARLRALPSGPGLVSVLRAQTRAGREALVSALVRQARRSPAPVWSAALVVAAAPWLQRVARRFELNVESPKDGVSLVVTAFLTVIFRSRSKGSSAWLKVQTQRQVIAWLREEGALEGGPADAPHRLRRPAPGRARNRARRLATVTSRRGEEQG